MAEKKRTVRKFLRILFLFLMLAPGFFRSSHVNAWDARVRIKDIARFGGVRENQLVGYGLVVGLDGTGDKNVMTAQSIANVLRNFGITIDPKALKAQNSAAVMVTANVEPFAREGDRISVEVSSIGDAKSLAGGMLLQTPLRGADGKVYAVAQGSISVGGAAGGGRARASGPTTAGRIPKGALIEREIPVNCIENGRVQIILNQKDFSTAARIARAVEEKFGPGIALPVDAGCVECAIPVSLEDNPVAFLAALENITIEPDAVTKVIINEKTGTIAMGENVKISPVVISHGTLKLQVVDTAQNPGATPPVAGNGNVILLEKGATVKELVEALNQVGTTPKDIIAVFQAIDAAGALHARLELL